MNSIINIEPYLRTQPIEPRQPGARRATDEPRSAAQAGAAQDSGHERIESARSEAARSDAARSDAVRSDAVRVNNVRFDEAQRASNLRSPADTNARETDSYRKAAPFRAADGRSAVEHVDEAAAVHEKADAWISRAIDGYATPAEPVDTYEFSAAARILAENNVVAEKPVQGDKQAEAVSRNDVVRTPRESVSRVTSGPNAVAGAEAVSASNAVSESDSLSEEVMQRISRRLARTNAIRAEIAAGTYDTSERISATVERLLDILV